MSINLATLFGQMITFGIFIWVIYKYVVPPMMTAIEERQNKISQGLANAEEAKANLENAQSQSEDLTKDAREKSAEIISDAEKRANLMIEKAKEDARLEGEKQLEIARISIEQEANKTKEELRTSLSTLVIIGAEKIVKKEIDASKHSALIEELAGQL